MKPCLYNLNNDLPSPTQIWNEPKYDNLNEMTKKFINDIKGKKESILLHIVRDILGLEINEKTGKRITVNYDGPMLDNAKYYIDYGKDSEIMFLEISTGDMEFVDNKASMTTKYKSIFDISNFK